MSLFDRIIRASIDNKIVVFAIVLLASAWGLYSLGELPIDALPDITNNQVQIITRAPTLGGEEIERLVTFPVEQALATLPNMEELRSFSRYGLSVITAVFEDSVDPYWARQQISERLLEVKSQIPPGSGEPSIGPLSTGLGEIYQYSLRAKSGYEDRYDLMELRTLQDWVVRRQLLGVPGVAEVSSFGGLLRQYEVAVDPELLARQKLSPVDVLDAVNSFNENAGAAYLSIGAHLFYIRAEGFLKSIADIKAIPLRQGRGAVPLCIGDVADVRMGNAVRYGAGARDEGEVVVGLVMMLKGANSQAVIDRVKTRMEEIRSNLPEGLILEAFLDRSSLVSRAIKTVATNLLEGALIVIFILVLVLGNFRAGLIVASVIPLAMLFAFAMMRLFGVSGNLMSLGAIDFGLLVDGAVIIVEAVVHHLQKRTGDVLVSRSQANDDVFEASAAIRKQASFGELIIMIVYLPILTLHGVEGKMFAPMAQTVVFAISGAFLLSLTYVPAMSALLLGRGKPKTLALSENIVSALTKLYLPLLSRALRYPIFPVLVSLASFVVALLLFMRMGGEFLPTLEEGDFAVETRLVLGSSLDTVVATTQRAAAVLKKEFSEVKDVVAKIGSGEIPTDPMPLEAADLMVVLRDRREWQRATDREGLAEAMSQSLHDALPGVSFGFQQPIQMRFNELMTGARQDVVLKIFGEDLATLSTLAAQCERVLTGISGIKDMYVEQIMGAPQLLVRYDRPALALHGVSLVDANRVLEAAFAGAKASTLYEGERRFDIVVRYQKAARDDIADFSGILVPTSRGGLVPFSALASVVQEAGPNQIQREEAKRRIIIGFNVRGRDVESIVDEARSKIAKAVSLPTGYSYRFGGQFEHLSQAKKRLAIVIPLALLFILLLLYLSFRTLSHTLLIASGVPMAAIGGVFALLMRGMPFSISAGIGFIALFGVAVLNGIVLVSALNTLKLAHGVSLVEGIIATCRSRLRPVLMTAGVASLGFLPMALSRSDGSEVQRPLATVVIGGLISSTVLTLFVLPALYLLIERRRHPGSLLKRAFVMLLCVFPFFCGCQRGSQQENVKKEHLSEESQSLVLSATDLARSGVVLGDAAKIRLQSGIEVRGLLDIPPSHLVTISAPLGGFVSDLEILVGEKVKKGQTLAVMEDMAFVALQQEYLDQKASSSFLRANSERQQALAKEGAASAKTAQQVEAELATNKNAIRALEERLRFLGLDPLSIRPDGITRRLPLRTPISGYVATVYANRGKFLEPGMPVLDVVDPSHLHVELHVFERDAAKIKTGQKVLFQLVDETKEREARVYVVGRTVTEERTLFVHAHMEIEDPSLRPGSAVRALVVTGESEACEVPDAAIARFSGKTMVFTTTDSQSAAPQRFVPLPIDVLRERNGKIAFDCKIFKGNPTSRLAMSGAHTLLSLLHNNEEED